MFVATVCETLKTMLLSCLLPIAVCIAAHATPDGGGNACKTLFDTAVESMKSRGCQEALEKYEEARACELEQSGGEENIGSSEALLGSGAALLCLGNTDESNDKLQKAILLDLKLTIFGEGMAAKFETEGDACLGEAGCPIDTFSSLVNSILSYLDKEIAAGTRAPETVKPAVPITAIMHYENYLTIRLMRYGLNGAMLEVLGRDLAASADKISYADPSVKLNYKLLIIGNHGTDDRIGICALSDGGDIAGDYFRCMASADTFGDERNIEMQLERVIESAKAAQREQEEITAERAKQFPAYAKGFIASGKLLRGAGETDAAIETFTAVISLCRGGMGPYLDSPLEAVSYVERAEAYRLKGRNGDASRDFASAMSKTKNLNEGNNPVTAAALLGQAKIAMGQKGKNKTVLDKLLDASSAQCGGYIQAGAGDCEISMLSVEIFNTLADAYEQSGNSDKADYARQTASEIYELLTTGG